MDMDLNGRTALITGSGSATGIGFAVARCLKERGAQVVLAATSDRVYQRAQALGGAAVIADLTDPDQVRRLPHEVDILVNNAGMISVGQDFEAGPVTAMSVQTWRAGLARNLDTAFLSSQHVLPWMQERGWGRIVNVTSVTGAVMAMRDEPVYAAAKAGMLGLTRSMALDFAAFGVTVNAVAPGWIATGSQTAQEELDGLATPMGRSGTPDEVAAAVAWFCLPAASYVTGQCLVIDGGNSIDEQRASR